MSCLCEMIHDRSQLNCTEVEACKIFSLFVNFLITRTLLSDLKFAVYICSFIFGGLCRCQATQNALGNKDEHISLFLTFNWPASGENHLYHIPLFHLKDYVFAFFPLLIEQCSYLLGDIS